MLRAVLVCLDGCGHHDGTKPFTFCMWKKNIVWKIPSSHANILLDCFVARSLEGVDAFSPLWEHFCSSPSLRTSWTCMAILLLLVMLLICSENGKVIQVGGHISHSSPHLSNSPLESVYVLTNSSYCYNTIHLLLWSILKSPEMTHIKLCHYCCWSLTAFKVGILISDCLEKSLNTYRAQIVYYWWKLLWETESEKNVASNADWLAVCYLWTAALAQG